MNNFGIFIKRYYSSRNKIIINYFVSLIDHFDQKNNH